MSVANVNLRRAVNYAIDRTALARLGIVSNRFPSEPTDQYLPPGIPGFSDVHIYPLTPNVGAARRLAPTRGNRAVLYTCNTSPCPQSAQIIKTDLQAIGIDVEIHAFPLNMLFGKIATKDEPFDLATIGWGADYQTQQTSSTCCSTGTRSTRTTRELRVLRRAALQPEARSGGAAFRTEALSHVR